VKQQEFENSESEDAIMFYVFNFREFAMFTNLFTLANVLGLDLVRRTYDDDDNTFIHLFTVLTN
jgi:hypothetical protein